MKQRLISVFLLMILMIVLLHNAIPHHHHQGVVMHNHESHHNEGDSDRGDDHHPEKCLIQSIDISVPRVQTAGKTSVLPCSIEYVGKIGNTIHFSGPDLTFSFFQVSNNGPPCKGVPPGLSSRGPPPVLVA